MMEWRTVMRNASSGMAASRSPGSSHIPGITVSESREGSNNQQDWHFVGHVEMDRAGDTKIYADDVMLYTATNKAVATGNVVFAQGDNRIRRSTPNSTRRPASARSTTRGDSPA